MQLTDAQKRVLRNTVDYTDGTSYVNNLDYHVSAKSISAMLGKGLLEAMCSHEVDQYGVRRPLVTAALKQLRAALAGWREEEKDAD